MKRFYELATVIENGSGFQVALDGRPIKTPLGAAQIVPSSALAKALAEEWRRQPETITPALFVFRDLADFAIDIVGAERTKQIDSLIAFLETDTLCYRADPGDAFFGHQQQHWEPLLTAFESREQVRLQRVSGIMHQPQPEATTATMRAKIQTFDAFTLTALLTLTSLAASLVIGLLALENDADIEALWSASNLEEDWQIEQWGADAEATAIRAQRKANFLNAREFYRLLND